jgi:hypothetical protein
MARTQLRHEEATAADNPDWAAMLSTPKYASFSSYLTGWFGTVGNWT